VVMSRWLDLMDGDLFLSILGTATGVPSLVLGLYVDRLARRRREEQHLRRLRVAIDRLDRAALWLAALFLEQHPELREGKRSRERRREIASARQEIAAARERLQRLLVSELTPTSLVDLPLWPVRSMDRKWVVERLHPALTRASKELSNQLEVRRR
jgi:hypothetical protein